MASSKHIGECKLCGASGPLCQSHIVPELVYRSLKNDKGQVYEVGRKVKKVQTGRFERLLCSACEQILSRYESHFQRVWMVSIPSDFGHLNTAPHKDVIEVAIDDFTMFKLFHLSILWRAAVSSDFKIEDNISLGRYERQIARMLIDGDAGQPGSFPFFASLNLDDQKHPVGNVTPLARGTGRYEGYHYYLMTYAYCDWIFIVADPGPAWMVNIEANCRATNTFLLLTNHYRQSKGFTLWADIFGRLSTDWRC